MSKNIALSFYRAMLCIRGTSHSPVSVRPSVCLSVTSQSSTKTAERRITQTTPHIRIKDSSFLSPTISAKFDRGHFLRGRRMQVGLVKIGDFRQIAGYISKTVQDRRMISIKVEYEVVCALSNSDIADDLQCPLTAPNYPYFCILHRHS